MKPIVRVARPEDAHPVWETYAYYIQNSVATFTEKPKTVEECRETIETLLKTYPYLIAEDENGKYLGFCCAEPIRPQTGYRFSAELTIYLHPTVPRHSGVGRLLYAALLDTLQAQGFVTVYGVIGGGNEASLALHRSFGFTEVARFPHMAYKHGQWLTAVWMRKTLNEPTNPPQEILPFEVYRRKERCEP